MITDENLKYAIPHFKYVHVNKGSYIFDEYEYGSAFYGIIKGKVTIISKRIKISYLEMKRKSLVYFDMCKKYFLFISFRK